MPASSAPPAVPSGKSRGRACAHPLLKPEEQVSVLPGPQKCPELAVEELCCVRCFERCRFWQLSVGL